MMNIDDRRKNMGKELLRMVSELREEKPWAITVEITFEAVEAIAEILLAESEE